eukprot:4301976-Pyramimonas_sp.AAC.1
MGYTAFLYASAPTDKEGPLARSPGSQRPAVSGGSMAGPERPQAPHDRGHSVHRIRPGAAGLLAVSAGRPGAQRRQPRHLRRLRRH